MSAVFRCSRYIRFVLTRCSEDSIPYPLPDLGCFHDVGSVRGYESGELGAGLATLSGSVSLVLPLPARVPGGPPPPVSFVLFADAGARDEALAGRKPSSSQPLASGASVGYGLRFGARRRAGTVGEPKPLSLSLQGGAAGRPDSLRRGAQRARREDDARRPRRRRVWLTTPELGKVEQPCRALGARRRFLVVPRPRI